MTNTKKGAAILAIAALGVVFGDIGTSPLYALQAVFGVSGQRLAINQTNVYGIISLIIWSVTLVVSIKFIGFIMRADNEGEGGILALVALIKSSKLRRHYKWLFIALGLVGVSFFYGDSVITPAISVLSAVEGLNVVTPHLTSFVLPITIAILASLFWVQKYGTEAIGRLFGPMMLVWFATIGFGGVWQIWQHPGVLQTLLPTTAIGFFVHHPITAFLSMTAVVLAITGAEALYADLGHFGRLPISKAWFWVVFPALALCYMGEGALVLHSPGAAGNVLVRLFPSALRIPIVLLSTVATVIASQAVISGAFSLTRQAMHLEFLPRMLVKHTSNLETGQIYMPFINFVLFVLVILLVLLFRSSASLANAYGIAVSITLGADTVLFLAMLRGLRHKAVGVIVALGFLFVPIDLLFITSNLQKVLHGGLFPILTGCLVLLVIDTWTKGEQIVDGERRAEEKTLQTFVRTIHATEPSLRRIPGTAVYIGHHPAFTPLALQATVEELHELPEKVVVVTVQVTSAAHIPVEKRPVFDSLGSNDDGICHLTLYYGYHDRIDIPRALREYRYLSPELDFELSEVAYFVSQGKVVLTRRHNLAHWRKSLYNFMSRNGLGTSEYYKLPIKQTEDMETRIKL
jgi:KUP system potassium uptake protein